MGYNFQIIVVKLPILPFKQHLAFQVASLISLEIRTFLAWFLVVLIKIPISEWLEMFAVKSKLLSQLVFITNSSLLFKGSTLKCQDPFLLQESSWLILPNRFKTRLKSTHLVGVKQQNNSKRSSEPIQPLIFLINTWDFS